MVPRWSPDDPWMVKTSQETSQKNVWTKDRERNGKKSGTNQEIVEKCRNKATATAAAAGAAATSRTGRFGPRFCFLLRILNLL